MAACQGDVPITTKVDEPMREFVDELAEDAGVSRAEVLRRLLELYHQSEEGHLECPSCTQAVRIRADNMELAIDEPSEMPTLEGNDTAGDTIAAHDTAAEVPNAGTAATSPNFRLRVDELESVIESQQQEIEQLRSKLTRQEMTIGDLSESDVSPQHVEHLQQQVEWHSNEIRHMIPRIEALIEVSDLSDQGICPDCGDELTVEQSFIDFSGPSAIKCSGCGQVIGHQV